MPNAFNLEWNGSNIGDITPYLISLNAPLPGKIGSKLTFKVNNEITTCYAFLYKNDVPLIIDEIKPIFGLKKIGRHKCILNKKRLLIAKIEHEDENVFNNMEHKYDIKEIQNIIVFRYIMGLISRGSFIWYRNETELISYKDVTISFEKKSSNITKLLLNKWFNKNINNVSSTMLRLSNNSKVMSTKTFSQRNSLIVLRIKKIVNSINPKYIYVCNDILTRMNNLILNVL